MKLIVGLGNPGEKYENTRHNIGFLVIDELIQSLAGLGNTRHETRDTKLYSLVTFNLSRVPGAIAKPQTFMNASGRAVKTAVGKYKVGTEDLLVIHDDLDISLGSYKLQFGKGPHLHNGVLSIERELSTKDFWRLRVGIENRSKIRNQRSKISGEEYVLHGFSQEEQTVLDRIIKEKIVAEIKNWLLKKQPLRTSLR